ncbi:transcriptional regulator, TetR family [Clostridium sp. DSM 8431]|uniref:TetR/AcrR family transcriptional regulator n=1 Tax=Clostridium sp. DSM 8431 TaxID=1761781 RepID=UPI0008E79FEF|nr:TetR/AcrR family transcriptional regulator [Clostridium sp. DSM 8431]SFU88704.1 transcriptional regulator, TetR family [Clostridium sp. DSM 8431]
MQPVDKRKVEFEQSKKKRMEYIVEKAAEIFCAQGIDNTKVTDIAKAADVGVASVYRYFKTKSDIVIQVGIKFWTNIRAEFVRKIEEDDFINQNGLEQFKDLGNIFFKLYNDYPQFLKYLHDFDSYIVKEKIEKDRLKEYEENILFIKELVVKYIEKGQADGSIKDSIDAEELYFTTTHTLMSLVQKLSLSGSVLESDIRISGEKQIKMISNMILEYIRNN